MKAKLVVLIVCGVVVDTMENMVVGGFLYDTLGPLYVASLGGAADGSPPPSSEDSESYVVYRNQISLSSIDCSSTEASAPDYFSLDLDATNEPSVFTPREHSASVRVSEPTLEGNWFQANGHFRSPMLKLHKEIMDFCDFLSPTPEEQAMRESAVESVSSVIKFIWPDSKVELFGSFKTGLYLPNSDIDLVILGSNVSSPQTGLHALSRALSQKGIAKKIQVIAKARIPIIKFVEKKSDVSFDISFDVENGPKAAEYIKEAISKWPLLRPLCLILKIFLQQRELNEVYTGGIGSFALLAMLIAMLQSLQDRRTPEHNLGILLVYFFDIYGRKLNTSDVGISCKTGSTFFLKRSRGFMDGNRPFLISIEDPQAPDNDVGKNSFNYSQVRSAFGIAFSRLTNVKTLSSLGPNRSILGIIIRPDVMLLERKGGSKGSELNNLLLGAGEPLEQQFGDQQIYCNWRFDEVEEEAFPRGKDGGMDGRAETPNRKRKSPKQKKFTKKAKENGDVKVDRHEENGFDEGKGTKKKRWRHKNGSLGNGMSKKLCQ